MLGFGSDRLSLLEERIFLFYASWELQKIRLSSFESKGEIIFLLCFLCSPSLHSDRIFFIC
ncbi:hypothetical protein FDUTEX481_04852 [Tolypothrix sp. PCC 7601]|nr:hypothetical protein FDUTEX481_04852 [Tolypothrix sp. PCC 7601]